MRFRTLKKKEKIGLKSYSVISTDFFNHSIIFQTVIPNISINRMVPIILILSSDNPIMVVYLSIVTALVSFSNSCLLVFVLKKSKRVAFL